MSNSPHRSVTGWSSDATNHEAYTTPLSVKSEELFLRFLSDLSIYDSLCSKISNLQRGSLEEAELEKHNIDPVSVSSSHSLPHTPAHSRSNTKAPQNNKYEAPVSVHTESYSEKRIPGDPLHSHKGENRTPQVSQKQLQESGSQLPNLLSVLRPSKNKRDATWITTLFGPDERTVGLDEFWDVACSDNGCKLPSALILPLFLASGASGPEDSISISKFTTFWKTLSTDPADTLVQILNPFSNQLETKHFVPLVESVLRTHPGLEFLAESPEFGPHYVKTVIYRIFYVLDRKRIDSISAADIRKSCFVKELEALDFEKDINKMQSFFSYHHFYVIYTTFWKLDDNHDFKLSQSDLSRYGEDGLSTLAIERIFMHAKLQPWSEKNHFISYRDFVYFILAEEDKLNPRSIEYWFQIVDTDSDGVISPSEMEQFYLEQQERMEDYGVEPMAWEDCLCQLLDVAQTNGKVFLRDLKRCSNADIFFNTLLNLRKFLDNEDRDPFQNSEDTDNAWVRFAALEYESLASEDDDVEDWKNQDNVY
eukprot:m.195737 g.195737  ORF g.195737 m.195737 type:complete len:536 (+) comp15692_c0_seq13:469-2076(+)